RRRSRRAGWSTTTTATRHPAHPRPAGTTTAPPAPGTPRRPAPTGGPPAAGSPPWGRRPSARRTLSPSSPRPFGVAGQQLVDRGGSHRRRPSIVARAVSTTPGQAVRAVATSAGVAGRPP